jgi:hypothetical protein
MLKMVTWQLKLPKKFRDLSRLPTLLKQERVFKQSFDLTNSWLLYVHNHGKPLLGYVLQNFKYF